MKAVPIHIAAEPSAFGEKFREMAAQDIATMGGEAEALLKPCLNMIKTATDALVSPESLPYFPTRESPIGDRMLVIVTPETSLVVSGKTAFKTTEVPPSFSRQEFESAAWTLLVDKSNEREHRAAITLALSLIGSQQVDEANAFCDREKDRGALPVVFVICNKNASASAGMICLTSMPKLAVVTDNDPVTKH